MSALRRIEAARVLTPAGWVGPAAVEVEGGVIAAVRALPATASDSILLPGFVDLQVNGIEDVDVATADAGGYERLGSLLAAQGTTTWCPTLSTAPRNRYEPWLSSVSAARAREGGPSIAGAHLEGPFLGSLAGAHARADVQAPDLRWLRALPDGVSVVTLGAEHDDAAAACRELVRRGILVALGHSAPSVRQVERMIDAGARMVTHCFNATGPIRARAPGLSGVALADGRLAISVIADLVHVDPILLRLVFRAKGRGAVCIVTDSVAWAAGRLGFKPIEVRDGAPRTADGALAGSCCTMDQAVRNLVVTCGLALEEVAHAASTTPAALLGLADRGAIEAGLRADLVALDPQLRVRSTWVAGEEAQRVPAAMAATDRSAIRRTPPGRRAG